MAMTQKGILEHAHRQLKVIDPMNPYVPTNTGLFERKLAFGGRERRVLIYVPEEVRTFVATMLILPPSGVSAEQFLIDSNWIELADTDESREKLLLAVMESDPDGWHIDEPCGKADGDVAYVEAVYGAMALRDICCHGEEANYLVGYGDGGAMAQMAAMFDPAAFAGVAAVDSPRVSEEYMAAAGEQYALNLNGYQDPEHLRGIRKRDIGMPVWLIGGDWADEWPETLYWRRNNRCDDCCQQRGFDTHCYVRTAPVDHPLDEDPRAFRVWISCIPGASEDGGRKVNRRIWRDFHFRGRRWMSNPGGSLRLHQDPIADLGMEYHYELIGGWMREWYVYVPESVKANPGAKVPMVFACHGYSCTAEVFISHSQWWRVADKHGFIVVFPTAIFGSLEKPAGDNVSIRQDNTPLPAWNTFGHREGRPYEPDFFRAMIDKTSADHAIDLERVYITGHSNGSMIAHMMVFIHPEWFAAVAPCSGIIGMSGGNHMLSIPEVADRRPLDVPVWMFGGYREEWLLPGRPEVGNATCESIHDWWDLNRMPGEKPTDFSGEPVSHGRFHNWFYEKNGVPMIRFSGIDYFPHATMAEQSFMIWEEFFSKFSRDGDGKVVYHA